MWQRFAITGRQAWIFLTKFLSPPTWVRRQRGEKLADRPHPVAVALGLVSPTLALVALMVSFFSYQASQTGVRLSEQSLRVANRAYLTVRRTGGNIDVDRNTAKFPGGDHFPNSARLYIEYDVENVGRTPGRLSRLDVRLTEVPDEWRLVESDRYVATTSRHVDDPALTGRRVRGVHLLWIKDETTIAPSTTVRRGHILRFDRVESWVEHLTEPAETDVIARSQVQIITRIRVDARLHYTDIFDEPAALTWCWFVSEAGRVTLCSPD